MSAMLRGRNLVFWTFTATGGTTMYIVETALFDLRGYLCFSGLAVWSALAAWQLR